jgi:hypothetical protein
MIDAHELEANVLSSLLGLPGAVNACRQAGLGPEDLGPRGRLVVAACYELADRGLEPSLQTVVHWLDERGQLEAVGGVAALNELDDRTPDANPGFWASKLVEAGRQQKLVAAMHTLEANPSDESALSAVASLLGQLRQGVPRYSVESFAELAAASIPPRELVFSPWLAERESGMVFAPRGVGKTYFALSLAIAVAGGGRFLEWFAPAARRTLYVDGEMDADALRKRIAALIRGLKAEPPLVAHNLKILSRDRLAEKGQRLPSLTCPEAQEGFIACIPQGTSLVILDNLSCLFGGDENDASAWDTTLNLLLRLRHELGAAVVFLHHSGKGGDQRGTSRREDALDFSLKLDPTIPEGELVSDGVRFRTQWSKTRRFRASECPSLVCELVCDPDALMTGWDFHRVFNAREEAIVQLWREWTEEHGKEPPVRELEERLARLAEERNQPELAVKRTTIHGVLQRARKTGALSKEGFRGQAHAVDTVRSGQAPHAGTIWRDLVRELTQQEESSLSPVVRSVRETAADSPDTGRVRVSATTMKVADADRVSLDAGQPAVGREPGSDDDRPC